MDRKLFLKNIGLSIGACLLSPFREIIAKSNINEKAQLSLKSFNAEGKLVNISGKFLDAKTLINIKATISIQKESLIFEIKKQSKTAKIYSIENDLGNAHSEKIVFNITANGYKPFEGQLLVNRNAVNIGSDLWHYNPNFRPENRPNQHKIENGKLTVNFDFHLVKM